MSVRWGVQWERERERERIKEGKQSCIGTFLYKKGKITKNSAKTKGTRHPRVWPPLFDEDNARCFCCLFLVVCEWKESSAVSFPGDTLHFLIRIHSLPVAAADSEKRGGGGGICAVHVHTGTRFVKERWR